MSTKIVDHRKPATAVRIGNLHKGEKFDWAGNMFIITGYEKGSVEAIHLESGQKHYIGEHVLIEPISVEIHVKAIP